MKRLIYTGPYEQHIGTPVYPWLPMVKPNEPTFVPDDLAEYLLTQPGWEEMSEEGADGSP